MITKDQFANFYNNIKPYLVDGYRGSAIILALALALSFIYVPFSKASPNSSSLQAKIKNIADFEGVRTNNLTGYGLVVGLNGTGDKFNSSIFTKQSFIAMLERIGINADGPGLNSKNIAAVMVTANPSAFSKPGTPIDVNVSSIGDATAIEGGMLLRTELIGYDGKVYATAEGPVVTGSISAVGAATSVTKGVPTNGRIANGGTIERELNYSIANQKELRLFLKNPDFTTAKRVAEAVNKHYGQGIATAKDTATIHMIVPPRVRDAVQFITEVEQLSVVPDQTAKVIIDEGKGIVVITKDVKISQVAVAQGNISVEIRETPFVSQPAPLSDGVTVVVPRTEISIDSGAGKQLGIVSEGTSLQIIVNALNALGVTPLELSAIIQAIKAAGALHAELELI